MQLESKSKNILSPAPVYAAGLAATLIGLSSLELVIPGSQLLHMSMALVAMGFIISWSARVGIVPKILTDFLRIAVCFAVLLILVSVPFLRTQLLQIGGVEGINVAFGMALAAFIVIYSFNLTTNTAVLFICVPTLSLIGVAACTRQTESIVQYFVPFFALLCFIAVQQNAHTSSSTNPDPVYLRHGTVQAISITLLALLFGAIIGTAVYIRLDKPLMTSLIFKNIGPDLAQFTSRNYIPVSIGPTTTWEQEVMTVTCAKPLLWRGEVFDSYDGHGWSHAADPAMRRPGSNNAPTAKPPKSTEFDVPQDASVSRLRSTQEIIQAFHITLCRFRMVFSAGEPEKITFNNAQSLEITPHAVLTHNSYGRETEYTAVARISIADTEQLQRASIQYPQSIRDKFLQVPASCNKVKRLTEQIVAGHFNNYDKADAIQSYLEQNCVYDLSAPAAPRNHDAVDYFIFTSKRGYCDMFATSMVIMAREAGIPARLATGFATGTPDGQGVFHVKFSDMHDWAELYFPNYGWIAFNPAAQEAHPGIFDSVKAVLKIWRYSAETRQPTILIALVVLLLIGYLVKVEVLDRQKAGGFRRRTGLSQSSTAQIYYKMLRLLAGYGYPKPPTMTPTEYSRELENLLGPDLESAVTCIQELTSDFVESRYGTRILTEEEATKYAAALETLRRELKTARKHKRLHAVTR
jgi:hypothetical protein